ncbi:hypothetical protein ACFWBN_31300 [Streptomyces sp. NPDC059989]|uniref:hypothetical protein n=1 Tax=Streptomyces sp. NPDC059989 TaxID=3347026 RepID=UPI00367D11BC
MRTAVRTAIATAVLAGALLAPAGAAFAATPLSAAAAASSVPDRYAGTPVSIGKGVVAVLRNKSEGPEVWVRAVSPDWKPGDDYIGKVLAKLDFEHPKASVEGLQLELVEEDVHHPILTVTKDGKTSSYPLPKGQGPECMSEPTHISIGAGMGARLFTSPKGPQAQLFSEAGDKTFETLTRTTPSLPEGAGIVARILNPSSAEPVFEWKTQGGGMPYGHQAFPKLPKGCEYDYKLEQPTQKPQPDPKPSTEPTAKPSAKPSAATPAAPKPQTAGQTSVVPKGGVAAGAEIATEDTDDSTTALAGTGLAAIVAALGAATLHRKRRAGAQR